MATLDVLGFTVATQVFRERAESSTMIHGVERVAERVADAIADRVQGRMRNPTT